MLEQATMATSTNDSQLGVDGTTIAIFATHLTPPPQARKQTREKRVKIAQSDLSFYYSFEKGDKAHPREDDGRKKGIADISRPRCGLNRITRKGGTNEGPPCAHTRRCTKGI